MNIKNLEKDTNKELSTKEINLKNKQHEIEFKEETRTKVININRKKQFKYEDIGHNNLDMLMSRHPLD